MGAEARFGVGSGLATSWWGMEPMPSGLVSMLAGGGMTTGASLGLAMPGSVFTWTTSAWISVGGVGAGSVAGSLTTATTIFVLAGLAVVFTVAVSTSGVWLMMVMLGLFLGVFVGACVCGFGFAI